MPDPYPKYPGDVTCRRAFDHHAERNAIDLAGGILPGDRLYVTDRPSCRRCRDYAQENGIDPCGIYVVAGG